MNIDVSAHGLELEEDLKKYTHKKISKIERYMPRYSRSSAHADVKLKESHAKNRRQFTCEVILILPHERITVSESTLNIFAAVDIAEATLKNRVKKYKEKHSKNKSDHKERKVRKLLGKILSR